MNLQPFRLPLLALCLACSAAFSGCASSKGEPPAQFDFGPLAAPGAQTQTQTQAGALGPIAVADVTGSSALDNDRMFYRLSYADAQQARTYVNSRWAATPLQMLTQRFKARLSQAGAKVIAETDVSGQVPILRIDVDDFIQDFNGVADSAGVVTVRASVFRGRTLVDQRSFSKSTRAASLDAGGGVRALAASTDAIAADLASWIATLNLGAQ
jgi:cholesterol transport system auxiliary component